MTNLTWYIGIALISLAVTTYTIYSKRHVYKVSTLLVFYLFAACVTWIGEFIVLGLFNAYQYKTGLFSDPWAQNLLGHLLINTTIYPTAAIVMAAYSLRYSWVLFMAAFFTLIEVAYIRLGIYEQHWWRYYMTFFAVIFFMSIFRIWFVKMKEKRFGLTRGVTFYFVAMLIIHLPAPVLLLLGKQYYQLSIINSMVGNLYLASIIIIFSYHLIESLLLVLFTCVLKRWYWRILPIVISIVAQSIFVRMNILVMSDGWSLIYTLLIYEMFIVLYIITERYTLKPWKDSFLN